MTSIERLQINGIRSFNPDPSSAQTVHFQKPLTVILGKNGAGKTTIIEALLNACTGAMPPGSGGAERSSFVYDPKVMGENEVKAQIRLIFTSKDGRNMQVIRSVQVTRTRTKRELKTLDNTVAYQDPRTGKVVSSTFRAADVDRVVPELLGVSPSVLKYVVFCHQEESNWPLFSPKDVKDIFDDLFAATRYVTVLEKLRKFSQEKKAGLKDHEVAVVTLQNHCREAKELEESIAKKEEHIKALSASNADLEPKLAELRAASAALDARDQQTDALTNEAAQIAGRMDQKRETIKRANLPPTSHSLAQVRELKGNLVGEAERAEATAREKAKTMEALHHATRQREQEQFSVRARVESLEGEHQQHTRNVAELREMLAKMPALRGGGNEEDGGVFVMGEDSVDERSLNRVMDAAKAAVQQARQESQRAVQDCAEKVAQTEERRHQVLRIMDADRKEEEMTESMLSSLTQQMKEARAAMQLIGGADTCRERLTQAQQEVRQLEKRVEAAEEVRKKGHHAQRRQRIGQEFDAQNAVVAGLRQAMARAKQRAGREGDLDRLRERIEEQKGKLDERLKVHILPQLLSLPIPAEGVGSDFASVTTKVEEARRRTEEELRQAREAHAVLDRAVAGLEQKRASAADQLTRSRTEEEEKSKACAAVLLALAQSHDGGSSADTNAANPTVDGYEQLLLEARASSEQSVQKRHALAALSACYSDFAEAAKASNSCAVCERPFSDHDELHRFIAKTEERQRASPKAVEAAQLEAARSHERVQKLEAMQRNVQDVRRLRALIPTQEEDLSRVEAELAKLMVEREVTTARLDSVAKVLSGITDVAYQLQSLRGIDAEVVGLKAQLAVREKQLAEEEVRARAGRDTPPPEEHAGKSYDELTEEYETATAQLHRLNEQLAELQRMEEGSGANAAEKELLEKQHAMYQLELTATKVTDLQNTLSRLSAEHQSRRTALQAIQNHRPEQTRLLEEATKALRELGEQRRRIEEAHNMAVATAEAQWRKLENAVPGVLKYIKEGRAKQLQAARERLKSLEADVQQGHKEVDALTRDIHAARAVISQHSTRMAEADRVIAVLELAESLKADEARLRDVEATLRELTGAKLSNVEKIVGGAAKEEPVHRLRELIRSKISELERTQATHEGSIAAVKNDAEELKKRLALGRYTDVEKRLRSTFLKFQSEQLVLKDADNYYAALEVGLQAYHKEKIDQINQIISDLWRQTYRGSDIDTIEIRSETESTCSTAVKRSYTYRVVIKRGDSELDMRGRCSAGQKVLASIIIRLALSETFCYDCGVLALDEPTTNLDEDNARSLAESLRSLIELKRNIKNFQLIVITHDEQFVRALGGHHLDHFYFVHKDRDGAFSIIERRTFSQLF